MVKASDLIKEQDEKSKHKNKVFNKIYKRIEKKITQSSNVNLYECWYEIPEFILNLPLYCLKDCKKYVIHKLHHNGFKTVMLSDTIIMVSWKPNKT
jgi:hypothetical protein